MFIDVNLLIFGAGIYMRHDVCFFNVGDFSFLWFASILKKFDSRDMQIFVTHLFFGSTLLDHHANLVGG